MDVKNIPSRTMRLCLYVVLVSALLLTITYWSLIYNDALAWSEQNASMKTDEAKLAYATFLTAPDNKTAATEADDDENDGYYIATRVLVYQLLHSKTARSTNRNIPFLVFCMPSVAERKRKRLERDGATVSVIEPLMWDSPAAPNGSYANMMTKLRLWQMTEYSKILFVDSDMLVTGDLSGVFDEPATQPQPTKNISAHIKSNEAALPPTYTFAGVPDQLTRYNHTIPPPKNLSYLNSGFFVLAPDTELFNYYLSLLDIDGLFDGTFPEQNLLNYAHRLWGNMPWQKLPYEYHTNWPTVRDMNAGVRSFHAKYWTDFDDMDPILKGVWRRKLGEMEGYYWGLEQAAKHEG